MNGFYQPYWSEELEHYGVKGMRWGVRKEDEKTSTSKSSKSVFNSDNISIVRNDNIASTYKVFMQKAQDHFKTEQTKLNLLAKRKNDPSINDLRGEKAEKLWNDSYRYAAEQMADEDFDADLYLAIMTIYHQMEMQGLTNDFTVDVQGGKGSAKAILTHKETGKTFTSIPAAKSFLNSYKLKNSGREKNIQGKAVSVKKGNKVSSKPVGESGSSKTYAAQLALRKKTDNLLKNIGQTAIKVDKFINPKKYDKKETIKKQNVKNTKKKNPRSNAKTIAASMSSDIISVGTNAISNMFKQK